MTTPRAAAYRANPDGSANILGFKHAIRLTKAQYKAHLVYRMFFSGAGQPWPVPAKCASCGAEAYFFLGSTRKGEELTIDYYKCGACGITDAEPFD